MVDWAGGMIATQGEDPTGASASCGNASDHFRAKNLVADWFGLQNLEHRMFGSIITKSGSSLCLDRPAMTLSIIAVHEVFMDMMYSTQNARLVGVL